MKTKYTFLVKNGRQEELGKITMTTGDGLPGHPEISRCCLAAYVDAYTYRLVNKEEIK